MISKEIIDRLRTVETVRDRYENQEVDRIGGKLRHMRNDWTPAQKRRMKKKLKMKELPFT